MSSTTPVVALGTKIKKKFDGLNARAMCFPCAVCVCCRNRIAVTNLLRCLTPGSLHTTADEWYNGEVVSIDAEKSKHKQVKYLLRPVGIS